MYFLEAVVEIGKDIVSRHYIELNETDLRKSQISWQIFPKFPELLIFGKQRQECRDNLSGII